MAEPSAEAHYPPWPFPLIQPDFKNLTTLQRTRLKELRAMRVRDSNRAAAFLLLTEDQWKNTLAVASKLPENLVNRLALDNIPLFLPNAFHQRVQILGISGLTGAAEPNMGEEQDIEAALQDLRREVDRIHSVLDKMLSAIQATRSAAVEHSKLAGIDIITSERAIELDAYPELDPRKATTFAGPYVNTIKNSMSDKEHAYKFHEFIQRHGHGNLSLVFVATLRWELGDPTIPEQEHLVTHTNQLPNTVTGFFPPLLPLQSHEEEEDYPFFIHGPLSPEHIMKIKSPSMLQSLARSMWLELDATATLQTNAKMILKQDKLWNRAWDRSFDYHLHQQYLAYRKGVLSKYKKLKASYKLRHIGDIYLDNNKALPLRFPLRSAQEQRDAKGFKKWPPLPQAPRSIRGLHRYIERPANVDP